MVIDKNSSSVIKKLVIVVFCVGAIVVLGTTIWRQRFQNLLSTNAVVRQARVICNRLSDGRVSLRELCEAERLSEVNAFRNYYAGIRENDGAWYQSKGSKYFPEVVCTENTVELTLLGQRFRCEDDGSVTRME